MDNIKHIDSYPTLIFKLGNCNDLDLINFNGHYWNPRFYYKGVNYLGS